MILLSSFQDVIHAIRDCAFVTSEYPVILSFENHCSRNQQYKMAKYCDDIFGDLLLKEPLPDFPLEPGKPLPPPARLLRKILIKNKRLRPDVEKTELELFRKGELELEESEEDKEDPKATIGASASPIAAAIAGSATGPNGPNTTPGNSDQSAGGAASSALQVTSTPYQGSTLNVHPFLSSMVNYTTPQKFQGMTGFLYPEKSTIFHRYFMSEKKMHPMINSTSSLFSVIGFEVAEEENCSFKMSSFAEATALGYLKTYAIELVNYNKRQLSRIYPKVRK